MRKLTPPQVELLGDLMRRPMRVVGGYPPAKNLAARGYATVEDVGTPYAWLVTVTKRGGRITPH